MSFGVIEAGNVGSYTVLRRSRRVAEPVFPAVFCRAPSSSIVSVNLASACIVSTTPPVSLSVPLSESYTLVCQNPFHELIAPSRQIRPTCVHLFTFSMDLQRFQHHLHLQISSGRLWVVCPPLPQIRVSAIKILFHNKPQDLNHHLPLKDERPSMLLHPSILLYIPR